MAQHRTYRELLDVVDPDPDLNVYMAAQVQGWKDAAQLMWNTREELRKALDQLEDHMQGPASSAIHARVTQSLTVLETAYHAADTTGKGWGEIKNKAQFAREQVTTANQGTIIAEKGSDPVGDSVNEVESTAGEYSSNITEPPKHEPLTDPGAPHGWPNIAPPGSGGDRVGGSAQPAVSSASPPSTAQARQPMPIDPLPDDAGGPELQNPAPSPVPGSGAMPQPAPGPSSVSPAAPAPWAPTQPVVPIQSSHPKTHGAPPPARNSVVARPGPPAPKSTADGARPGRGGSMVASPGGKAAGQAADRPQGSRVPGTVNSTKDGRLVVRPQPDTARAKAVNAAADARASVTPQHFGGTDLNRQIVTGARAVPESPPGRTDEPLIDVDDPWTVTTVTVRSVIAGPPRPSEKVHDPTNGWTFGQQHHR